MSPVDRLEARVKDLNRQLEALRRENKTLRSERNEAQRDEKKTAAQAKAPPPKAMSLNTRDVQKIGSQTAAPAVAAGAVVYIWLAILSDVNARFFIGLSVEGFWRDVEVNSWVTVGLTVVFSAIDKFVRKHT